MIAQMKLNVNRNNLLIGDKMEDILKTCLYRIDETKLYPVFYLKICQTLQECLNNGQIFVATSGYRSYQEQELLYAQGRTSPGKICTNARGNQSQHNFAIAADFCRDLDPRTPGLQPSWELKHLKPLIDVAIKNGLEAGAYWKTIKDTPHLQLPLGKYGIKIKDLDKVYRKNNSLNDVWDFLDTFDWG